RLAVGALRLAAAANLGAATLALELAGVHLLDGGRRLEPLELRPPLREAWRARLLEEAHRGAREHAADEHDAEEDPDDDERAPVRPRARLRCELAGLAAADDAACLPGRVVRHPVP